MEQHFTGKTILIKPLRTTAGARLILCDHCERELLASSAYRVSSEDLDGLLLEMTVCHPCRVAAQALGLKTTKNRFDESYR